MSNQSWLSVNLLPLIGGAVIGAAITLLLVDREPTVPDPPGDGVPVQPTLLKQSDANALIKKYSDPGKGINIPIELHETLLKQIAERDKVSSGSNRTDVKGHRAYWGKRGANILAVIYPLVERQNSAGQSMLAVDMNVYKDSVLVVQVQDRMDPCPQACYCVAAGNIVVNDCSF